MKLNKSIELLSDVQAPVMITPDVAFSIQYMVQLFVNNKIFFAMTEERNS